MFLVLVMIKSVRQEMQKADQGKGAASSCIAPCHALQSFEAADVK